MKIDITNYRPINKGALLGSFSLALTFQEGISLSFSDCKYFSVGERSWFSFYQKEVKKQDGSKSDYFSIIRVHGVEKEKELKDLVVKEVEKHVKTSDKVIKISDEAPALW